MKPKAQYIPGALLLALGATPLIAGVTIPHTFQSGETAVADEVNANFEALREELAEARSLIEDMRELHDHVEVIHIDPHDANARTVRFSGVDVQIVNGEGETDIVNGVGNLIVGYNEPGSEGPEKSGSHNIVGGSGNAYSSYGGLVVGEDNAIEARYASVSAGRQHVASGVHSSVSGGVNNIAEADGSSVSGGHKNKATGLSSSVSGGGDNEASGMRSSVSGGTSNSAAGSGSSVSGGRSNTAGGSRSSILGGYGETASDADETIPAID